MQSSLCPSIDSFSVYVTYSQFAVGRVLRLLRIVVPEASDEEKTLRII